MNKDTMAHRHTGIKFITIMHYWFLLVLVLYSVTGADTDFIEQGNRLYGQTEYNEALKQYEQAELDGPAQPILAFNQANCYYKLEDYARAIDLYQQVSSQSKDMSLVAQAKYNLGNCHYQQGQKQIDSDLQKAVEGMTTSIRYYREALDLNPEDEDARRNIAVVRLQMKDLMDRLKKQQEEQEQQKQLQQKIAEALQKQLQLNQKTAQAHQQAQQPDTPPAEKENAGKSLAQEQAQLKDNTTALQEEARQMINQMQSQPQSSAQQGQGSPQPQPPQSGQAPGPAPDQPAMNTEQMKEIFENAEKSLHQAAQQQDMASENLDNVKMEPAQEYQQQAAQKLKEALEAFPQQPQQNQSQPQEQNADNNQQQQQQQDQQEQSQQEQQNQQDQQEIQAQQAPDTTAQDILNEEKEQKQQRERARGSYQPVDKDW
ncbi:MAG: tetratricopeptide repeat protein [Sedimentisphaerales bacterium]|nr:tetratricopeptide repeat protein [Sedimentisphaerales bacterium]